MGVHLKSDAVVVVCSYVYLCVCLIVFVVVSLTQSQCKSQYYSECEW